jgi:hypothetical protein
LELGHFLFDQIRVRRLDLGDCRRARSAASRKGNCRSRRVACALVGQLEPDNLHLSGIVRWRHDRGRRGASPGTGEIHRRGRSKVRSLIRDLQEKDAREHRLLWERRVIGPKNRVGPDEDWRLVNVAREFLSEIVPILRTERLVRVNPDDANLVVRRFDRPLPDQNQTVVREIGVRRAVRESSELLGRNRQRFGDNYVAAVRSSQFALRPKLRRVGGVELVRALEHQTYFAQDDGTDDSNGLPYASFCMTRS